VDRPFAVEATLDMDLRLITIVASTVAQVLKVNRILHVEKEEILTRDERIMTDLKSLYKMESIAGQSAAISKVLTTAAIAARSSASVLISGETGTGKEMVANVVHYNSDRAKGPIVKVNCGALPESLLESELFGTCAAPSPAPSATAKAVSNWPTGERCFSTKWRK
jgi:Nif-specific regulatory protein